MAKLIECRREILNEYDRAWFGYFKGTPTPKDIKDAQSTIEDFDDDGDLTDEISCIDGEQMPTEISKLAGLERWFLGPFDLNQRTSGYEPDEMPTSLLCSGN